MDVYVEQLIVKSPDGKDMAKKVLIIAGAAVIVILCFLFFLPIFAAFVGFGVVYGAYYLLTGIYCEYEYIVTNGDIDIDKIVGKRKRTRLVSASVKNFTSFGRLENAPQTSGSITTVKASDGSGHDFYADFTHSKLGATRIIFSPSEKTLEAIKPFLPRTIKRDF